MFADNAHKEVVGAVFPIKPRHVPALFECNRDVFVKFTNLELENDFTIVLYVSGDKTFIGEAKVKQIRRMNPNDAWISYKERIFLNEREYSEYVNISPVSKAKRKMKEITVLELDRVRKYRKPIKSEFSVAPSGRYLTKEMANKIKSSRE